MFTVHAVSGHVDLMTLSQLGGVIEDRAEARSRNSELRGCFLSGND